MSPASSLFEIAASTRRMILPERVFGMSRTIMTRRGRAMGPISRSTEFSTRGRMSALEEAQGDVQLGRGVRPDVFQQSSAGLLYSDNLKIL